MLSFNLIRDPWIPVVTTCGRRLVVRPADLSQKINDDPIVEVDWPRADFRVGAYEFLIGLLATACVPTDNSTWQAWWDRPPSTERLSEAFEDFENAFDMLSSGPRFLQERAHLGEEAVPIAGLLIDQPGANAEKNNTDLFVKRGTIEVLGLPATAMALYVMQAFAPAGGAGHRTGLRGGGPLTTLALPATNDLSKQTLFHKLWLNVTALYDPDRNDPLNSPERTFPWLAPTRVSDKDGKATTAVDIHPAQCFWGMPRRIALIAEDNADGLPCAITGRVEPVIVRSYRTRPYGVNYQAVEHPLTPRYSVKSGTEKLPVHPQPGGIAYRQWLGFVQETELREPADCIITARKRLSSVGDGSGRIAMAGYDMDNMKARGFVEAQMPLFLASDAGKDPHPRQDAVEALAVRMVAAAVEVRSLIVGQIRAALGDDASGLDLIGETFFKATEAEFFERLRRGVGEIEANPENPSLLINLCIAWLNEALAPEALRVFDRNVPIDAIVRIADPKAIKSIATARAMLTGGLKGYGASGRAIFAALGMAQPESRKKEGTK